MRNLGAQPGVVGDLLGRLANASDAQVRHLAAVLLRKRVTRHWASLSAEVGWRAAGSLLVDK